MECILNSSDHFFSENFIDAIIKDSVNNKSTFMEINVFLKADHILHVRYIRNNKITHQINYVGTLNPDELIHLIEAKSIRVFPHILTDTNIFRGCHSIELKQYHQSFDDIFIFDIEEDYLSSLNYTSKYALYERLQSLVNYLYIKIILSVNITIKDGKKKTSKTPETKKPASPIELCQHLNLTKQELAYLNAISLTGSSKEIARAVNKSSRTIEKVIQNLLNKLEIKNKSQLQIMAKILTSHINQSEEQHVLALTD